MSSTTNSLIPTFVTAEWKQIWDEWNLRGFIILSLSLQAFLVIFAPLRKRTTSNLVTIPLWTAYLLADWAANFAVGLISSSVGDTSETNSKGDLIAFWAPFLLVHLGGPDSITAFALEDNELWLRHLFGLTFQCLAAVYVLLQSLPTEELWIPTILMFLTGIIKYTERTRSLYLASFNSFQDSLLNEPDPGPDYEMVADIFSTRKKAHLPTRIEMIAEPDRILVYGNRSIQGELMPLEVVQYAYQYFETFKGLVVNLIFSNRVRHQSRDFFLSRTPKDAFDVIEVELNFFYEVFYTKLRVVYTRVGYICRLLSLGAVTASLVLFHSFKKDHFPDFDVGLTYTLLIGALALDGIALFMLIFSDFTFITLGRFPAPHADFRVHNTITKILTMLLQLKTRGWFYNTCLALPMAVLSRRWSKSVAAYNLIHCCLYKRSKLVEILYSYLGILTFIDNTVYVKQKLFPDDLKDFIFDELKTKSDYADDPETSREISSARGDWVLQTEDCSALLQYIIDVDYDESILLWHIATELCYNSDHEEIITEEERNKMTPYELNKLEKKAKFRHFSKLLSDYMLYLLIMKPAMMSPIRGIGHIRFQDTCAEANRFFSRDIRRKEKGFCFPLTDLFLSRGKSAAMEKKIIPHLKDEDIKEKACKNLLDIDTEIEPILIKGDKSMSVLFDGCRLAKELVKLRTENVIKDEWEVLSKVWVELMCYASSRIEATSHVQQVSKGGELITIVWLLMIQLGLGAQFQIKQQGRVRLITGK